MQTVNFTPTPRHARLKSDRPGTDVQGHPYATVESRFDSRDVVYASQDAGSPTNDYRMVTITLYGTRADVVAGAALVMNVFNHKLGAVGQPTLAYPSGARFIRWWPVGQIELSEDPAMKAGRDVWRAVIRAKVWSIRQT